MSFLNRDISWLSFNYRVLQEAKDLNVPVVERIRFQGIYSSNLDEFFRVRIATIKAIMRSSKKVKKELDYSVEMLHKQLMATIHLQQLEFEEIFKLNINDLAKNNVLLLNQNKLTALDKEFISTLYEYKISMYLQPLVLHKQKIRPFLVNASLYLAIDLQNKNGAQRLGLVRIPSQEMGRFIELPTAPDMPKSVLFLDDAIRAMLPTIFPGFTVKAAYSFKLTRDQELYLGDEFSGDLISKIKTGLQKRNVGLPTRFIYDRKIPSRLLTELCQTIGIQETELIEEGQYHNNSDLLKFPNVGAANTVYKPLPPLNHSSLSLSQPLLPFIQNNDLLLQYPYQSYNYVINFFKEAVENTEVREIWITQYRVARNSIIMKLLIDAVKKGKKVNVFIEIKARFDEEQNLLWAQELTDAGVKVTFSLPGIKVHCKLALIRRTVNRKQAYSVYISTGNFNESTSKIYSDFGLFTSDERYTSEVRQVFTYLGTGKRPTLFKHLLIGQFGLFEKLQTLIQNEQKFAEQGQSAQIILKINSIEEENIINNLYEASQAGVDIKIIVRGICCLKPGLPEISENIKAISIIDRFLEHARIFVFNNNGNRLIYLSSADIMERNLHRRIECAFPIYNPLHQKEIMDYLDIQLNDNAKARIIDYTNQNQRQITTSLERFESQHETYQYYKNKLSN